MVLFFNKNLQLYSFLLNIYNYLNKIPAIQPVETSLLFCYDIDGFKEITGLYTRLRMARPHFPAACCMKEDINP